MPRASTLANACHRADRERSTLVPVPVTTGQRAHCSNPWGTPLGAQYSVPLVCLDLLVLSFFTNLRLQDAPDEEVYNHIRWFNGEDEFEDIHMINFIPVTAWIVRRNLHWMEVTHFQWVAP
jgi:hypothetical protein